MSDIVKCVGSNGHGFDPGNLSTQRFDEQGHPDTNAVLLEDGRQARRKLVLPALVIVVVQIL